MANQPPVGAASERWQLSRLPPSLSRTAVALVLLLSFAGAAVAWRAEASHVDDRNHAQAQRAAAALETIMRATGESLLGAQALGTTGTFEPDQFVSFASGVVVDSEFTQLFYLAVVPGSGRKAFEKQIGQSIKDRPPNAPPLKFVDAPTRSEYAPIAQVWPTSATTKVSLGFDYLGDPIRGPALRTASAVGAPRATAPLRAAVSGRIGWSVVNPVFAGYRTTGTAATMRGALVGYVGGTIYGDEIGAKVSELVPDTTSLSIVDSGTVMYSNGNAPKGTGGTSTSIKILGRTLVVAADTGDGIALTWPALILIAGLSVAGFTARTYAVSAHRSEAIARANEELDRAARSIAALQELTARLASSSSSADMARALTTHVRAHEPGLLGSGVIMVGGSAQTHTEDSIDELPEALYQAVLEAAETSPTVSAEEGRAVFGAPEAAKFGIDPASIAALPLTRGGIAVGVLLLVFERPQRFDVEQRLRLTSVAAMGSQSLERALRYDEEHAMATSLQRSLLPQTLPQVEGVQLAVRYIPAAETALVGGDWYDAFAVTDGVAFVVGDAVGHGVEAASAMGQIRSATRVAMLAGESPSTTLEVLDSFVAEVPGASDATALVAVIDVGRLRLKLSRAGHIPPLLVRDGTATYLEDGGSLPLGWPDHTRPLAEFELQPDDMVVLLTDGVVERRDVPLNDRLDQLARVCADDGGDLDAMSDRILHEMGVERPTDDVALLVVRLT